MSEAYDLIYAGEHRQDIKQLIQEAFPQAQFTDASDFIHQGRFQVVIEGTRQNRWLIWAISAGLFDMSFDIQVGIREEEMVEHYKRLISAAKRLVNRREHDGTQ